MTEVFGSGSGGNSGHVIVDESGSVYPERSNLKFINASITDDAVNDMTIVEVEGGGIPLDAPTGISITNTDEGAILCWTDPADKVVDGTTLAAWAGTKIVRKVGAPPTKATDGVLVVDSKTRNQYSSTGFEDTGLTNGVVYYYGFFPYTTAMGFTYTETRQFTPEPIYPTAINDVAADKGYQSATVTFTKPADATGVRLVYGTTEPASEIDGAYIDGVTSPYTINNLTNGTKYYIKAYAYNAKNRFIASNTAEITPSAVKIYGFHHNFSNLDPATCITYLSGTENENYSPMMTNEGQGTATAGSWATFLTDVLLNKPAMVKKDATLDYWLDPTDYTKKADGTASDYNNLSYSGAGAFSWIQKAYMKEVYAADGNSRDVYFAFGGKPDDTYYNVGFRDSSDELEGVWMPMAYMDASGRTLVAGTTPVASKTCQQEKSIIDGIGTRARFYGGPIVNFMRDLMYLLYKCTDIQLRGGYGRCNAGSQQVVNNANVVNGNVVGFKGTGDKKTMNKAFHSQLLFSYQQYCRDPYTLLDNGILKYSDNYEYDITGGTYKTAGDTTWGSLNSGWHYGSHLVKSGDNFGSTPKKEDNATNSTGLCDGLYCNTSGVRVALRFGPCRDDLLVGPGCLLLGYEASNASWGYGVGVLLLPPKGYAPAA